MSFYIVLLPLIAVVAGVKIYIYLKDHKPPHFHARYNGYDEKIRIRDGKTMRGGIDTKKSKKVKKWAAKNKKSLEREWRRYNP